MPTIRTRAPMTVGPDGQPMEMTDMTDMTHYDIEVLDDFSVEEHQSSTFTDEPGKEKTSNDEDKEGRVPFWRRRDEPKNEKISNDEDKEGRVPFWRRRDEPRKEKISNDEDKDGRVPFWRRPRFFWTSLCLMYVAAMLGIGWLFGNHMLMSDEEKVQKMLAENPEMCIPGRIQHRQEVTMYLALEGVSTNSTENLESIIADSVQTGYNSASGMCSDECSRWTYLAEVLQQDDYVSEDNNTAVYAQVQTYLSEYNCPPGEHFASVYPQQLDRRMLGGTLAYQQLDEVQGRALRSLLSGIEDDEPLDVTHGFRDSYFEDEVDIFGVRRHLSGSGGVDFSDAMYKIELEMGSRLDEASKGRSAGFSGIAEVMLVQRNADGKMSAAVWSRQAPPPGCTKAAKGSKAPKGTKGPIGTKGPKGTKAPGTKAPKVASIKCKNPSWKGTKVPLPKSTKLPKRARRDRRVQEEEEFEDDGERRLHMWSQNIENTLVQW